MKFNYIEGKGEEDEVEVGDIVKFSNGLFKGTVCLITFDGAVSLEKPTNTWNNYETLSFIKLPKGSKVILEQE